MEPSTSSTRAFVDTASRTWSPPGRPTVNTSAVSHNSSTSTPVDRSPHPSSVSNSSHSSPWLQQMALSTASQSQPGTFHTPSPLSSARRAADLSNQQNSHPSLPQNWSNVFSSPLDPSTFAALAASGVLGLPAPTVPPSLPSRAMPSQAELMSSQRGPGYAKEFSRAVYGQGGNGGWQSMNSAMPISQRVQSGHRSNPGSVSYIKRRPSGSGALSAELTRDLTLSVI